MALVVKKKTKKTKRNLPANARDVRDGFNPWVRNVP